MVEIRDISSPELIDAVRVWTGWGANMMPSRDERRLVKQFGDERAARLISVIKSLEDDFYSSDARFVAADLQDMGKMASEQFKKKHPMVPDEIVKVFAWCYTFDFR